MFCLWIGKISPLPTTPGRVGVPSRYGWGKKANRLGPLEYHTLDSAKILSPGRRRRRTTVAAHFP